MNILGVAHTELERAGGLWTAREIAQQPSIWSTIDEMMAREAAGVRTFLEPLLARPDLRVVLTGAGTSAFVGDCLAPALKRRIQHQVVAIATTDLIAAPGDVLDPNRPMLLISFARSGNSPESVAALKLAAQCVPDCHHLIVTCNRDGELYREALARGSAHIVLLPEQTNDRGFAMTSSFTGMMLAMALAFGLQSHSAAAIAAWGSSLLGAGLPLITSLAKSGFERVVYLGSREFKGLAHEAALKMLELSDGRIVALAETPLGFRHGPKTIVNDRTLVVVFLSNDPYARRYELDLLRELRADGVAARVVALQAGAPDAGMGDGSDDDVAIPGALGATDLELCFPYIVFAQTLAFLQSLALGLRPDVPNARGVVSRVVQGVSIYPWGERE